jgi:hypothetical protein
MMYLSKQSKIPIRTSGTMPTIPCSNTRLYDTNNHQPNHTLGTFPNHPQSHSARWVLTTTQTVLWAPFQTNHHPNLYMRYLSKPSTFPIRTPGTNHNLIHTLGTFPNHIHSQSVHVVPCQAIHNPIPYTGY